MTCQIFVEYNVLTKNARIEFYVKSNNKNKQENWGENMNLLPEKKKNFINGRVGPGLGKGIMCHVLYHSLLLLLILFHRCRFLYFIFL